MKTLLLIIAVILLISCERKSGRIERPNTPLQSEKVVIIDSYGRPSYTDGIPSHTYKVKRINQGVVDYCTDRGLYEKGDTILIYPMQFK